MNETYSSRSLIILVADKDMEQAVAGICRRPQALGMNPFSYNILVHPGRDPGCLREGVAFLRSFHRQYAYALLLFDRMGCGQESKTRVELEKEIEEKLSQSGWVDRSAVVAIDPELEAWIWSDSPHVDRVLGWQGHSPTLHEWLVEQQWLEPGMTKPTQPKEAMEQALRTVRQPRSPAHYRQLAERVSLSRCTDASFLKFKTILQSWFAP